MYACLDSVVVKVFPSFIKAYNSCTYLTPAVLQRSIQNLGATLTHEPGKTAREARCRRFSSDISTVKKLTESGAHAWLDRFKTYERMRALFMRRGNVSLTSTFGVPENAGIKDSDILGLERMHLLLDRLGSPHLRIPNVIHVVGTKGKGSVTALLAGMLTSSGETVGSYGSPHVFSFYERITSPGT